MPEPDQAPARAQGSKLVTVSQQWSGPLPSPAAMAEYDRIAPGTAAKLIDAMLVEGEHRRRLEVLEAETRARVEEHDIDLQRRAVELSAAQYARGQRIAAA
jgi:uncharacterized membrane protein